MCKCTPEIRTPFCGKPGCGWGPDVDPAILGEVPAAPAVLKHVSYSLGDDADLEAERRSMAVRALMQAGATPTELGDMHSGLTVIDGKVCRILAVYVANPIGRNPDLPDRDDTWSRFTAGHPAI